MKLDRRLEFLKDPVVIIAGLLLILMMGINYYYERKIKEVERQKIKLYVPTTDLFPYNTISKQNKELSIWRFGYYEHLYYTD